MTTNASGLATLTGVSLAEIGAGTHTGAVGASFAGDTTHGTTPQAGSGPTFTLAAGMYDIVAAVTNPNCTAARDEAVLAVVSPADAANGGGWYKATTIQAGSPRVNLGFTIHKTTKSTKGSTDVTVTYKGGLLWLNNGQWRFKTSISTTTVTTAAGAFVSGDQFPYGTMAACPAAFISTLPTGSTPKCGSLTGKGTLERWDSTANGGLGGWVASTAYGPTVTFTATIYDGGQGKVCSRKSCTTTDNPDWFGIQFDPVPSSVIRESAPFPMSGGALKTS